MCSDVLVESMSSTDGQLTALLRIRFAQLAICSGIGSKGVIHQFHVLCVMLLSSTCPNLRGALKANREARQAGFMCICALAPTISTLSNKRKIYASSA